MARITTALWNSPVAELLVRRAVVSSTSMDLTNRRRVDMSLKIRFHDLRHTFASLLIQNGEPLTYVKEQMGHSSIQVTVDVYGHIVPSANRAAVYKLDALPARNPDATGKENPEASAGGK